MTDSSDGDSVAKNANRKFANLNKNTPVKIADTLAFHKLCYNLKNGMQKDSAIAELKLNANTDTFKTKLQIPKKTSIEVNVAEKTIETENAAFMYTVHFMFHYKGEKKHFTLKVNQNTLIEFAQNYIRDYVNEKIPMDIVNPTLEKSSENVKLTVEQKIDNLTEQVGKLTALLMQERELNNELKAKILQLELQVEKKPSKKRKHRSPNTSIANKKSARVERTHGHVTDASSDDDNISMCSQESEKNTQPIQTNTTATNTTTNTNANKTRGQNEHIQNDVPTQHESFVANSPTKQYKNVPPIIVFDTNQKRMNERILQRKVCSSAKYHFVRVNKSKYRIQASTLEQYDAILELLTEVSIKYHTYTPSERKPIHVLIKHIPICYDESDILHHLKEDFGVSPIRLTTFVTKYMSENNIQTPIWHASFDPKTDKKKIFTIKRIGNFHGISIEELKNKSITQCRRCWRFEHTQSNCTYDIRCNNCLENHITGSCSLDSNAALKPSCVNCKSQSHSVTSRDCPVYQRILERKNSPGNKKTKNTIPAPFGTSNLPHTNPNASFASTVRGNQKQTRTSTQITTNNSEIMDILKQMAAQQAQMTNLFMKIAPQLVRGNSK